MEAGAAAYMDVMAGAAMYEDIAWGAATMEVIVGTIDDMIE